LQQGSACLPSGCNDSPLWAFARRALNVEDILCLPIQDCDKSHIWLLVKDDQRLE
ncbi:TPA: hypothetical protein JYK93_004884, partial [Escherichia coli MVAST084]|nr:hypothetical protein [Escherichia coli MVAST084]HDT2619978.1 hypothetical protein [Escherichia coli]